MDVSERLEELAMTIIANSGAGRSSSFEALRLARSGDTDNAVALLKEADTQLHAAHEAHRELLKLDARGEIEKVTILLTHAQDHLMTSVLAKELIEEMVLLHSKIARIEEVEK